MANQDDESIDDAPNGWLKLYRRIIKSEVFQDPNLLQLWVLLLSRASINERYEQIKWGNANRIIHVLPGQCIVGRNQTARFLKWTPSSFRNRLERLRKMKMVQLTSYQGFTIVTIKNWSRFQTRNKSKKDSIKGQAENARKPLKIVGEVDSTLHQKDSMKGQAEDKPRTSGGQAEDTNKEGFKNDRECKEWGRIVPTLVEQFETIFQDYPKLAQADKKRLAAEIGARVQLGKVQPHLAGASLREAIGATLQRNKRSWSSEHEIKEFPDRELFKREMPTVVASITDLSETTTTITTSTPTPRDASAPEPSDVERFFNSHVYPTLSQFHWESHSQFYDHWRQRHWQREGKPIDWQAEAVRPKRSPTQRGTI
jgi:hypothetical protein